MFLCIDFTMFHLGCGSSMFSGMYILNKTMKNIFVLNIFIHAKMTAHMMVYLQADIDTFSV